MGGESAAGAACPHPPAKATQAKHVLGAGAHAARAAGLRARAGGPGTAPRGRPFEPFTP